MPFEQQLIPKIREINPGMQIVDTLEGVELIYGEAHYHYYADGAPFLHAADEPLNPLDPDWPEVMKTMAEAISEGVY